MFVDEGHTRTQSIDPVTDLGIGLAHRPLRPRHRPGPDTDTMRLYVVAVAAFLAGGIAAVVA